MEKVTHCIDPCMKYCQSCEYAHVTVVDDGAFGEVLETSCIWGLEDDPPTEEEEQEFARWCNESFERVMKKDPNAPQNGAKHK